MKKIRDPFIFACDEEKIQEAIRLSKKAFAQNEAERTVSHGEFLFQQSRYIKKRWWLLQAFLLAALWWFLQTAESDYYIQRCLGIGAPLFVLLVFPELWKNRGCNAMEVECTTYYTLRKIYAARMVLFAGVDLVLLSLFFCAATMGTRLTAWDMLVQFLLPFNVTCCICFGSLYSRRNGSEAFSLLLCFVWAGIWVLIVLQESVYTAISTPMWCTLLLASFGYLGYTIHRGQENWRNTWEAKPLWN